MTEWSPFRVLVTGSRHATNELHLATIRSELMLAIGHIKASELADGRVVLVHGAADGVDTIAQQVMRDLPWPIRMEPYPAEDFGSWPACGPKRNSHMVSLGASVCLAFPQPGSKGTWDCARKAADAGIQVVLRSLVAS